VDLGLDARVAIVTGASRGIGRQVAVRLAAEGCAVVACARSAADLASVVDAIRAAGGRADAVALDLTEAGSDAALVRAAVDGFGRIDILVNNAGGSAAKKLLALTDSDWREGFELNFFAAARLALACVPAMQEQHWGRIVNVASTYAREPDPYFGPYAAAKAALVNLTKSMGRAFSADGVLVNCVIPGLTSTELVATNTRIAADAAGITADEVIARMLAKDPIAAGRLGGVDEIAAAICFLASEQSSWISGACLAVDGCTLRSMA
jgi:3-oxoacyl-[acyl-carrier protein] reductase